MNIATVRIKTGVAVSAGVLRVTTYRRRWADAGHSLHAVVGEGRAQIEAANAAE